MILAMMIWWLTSSSSSLELHLFPGIFDYINVFFKEYSIKILTGIQFSKRIWTLIKGNRLGSERESCTLFPQTYLFFVVLSRFPGIHEYFNAFLEKFNVQKYSRRTNFPENFLTGTSFGYLGYQLQNFGMKQG